MHDIRLIRDDPAAFDTALARRARALDDVLIPEAGRELAVMETGLEDLEREDAIAMRLGREPRDRLETFAELRAWKDGFAG